MESSGSESASPMTHRVQSLSATTDTRGKHRIQAELKRLEQEARFLMEGGYMISTEVLTEVEGVVGRGDEGNALSARFRPPNTSRKGRCSCPTCNKHAYLHFNIKEELGQLEGMDKASASCKEMLSNVETRPDPLLPVTIGPLNPLWDRWFEGPQDSTGCRCWIL